MVLARLFYLRDVLKSLPDEVLFACTGFAPLYHLCFSEANSLPRSYLKLAENSVHSANPNATTFGCRH